MAYTERESKHVEYLERAYNGKLTPIVTGSL
jgi:hypothetical protein